MSILSLLSSLLITAVLQASFTSCRSSERPGVMALIFHFPSLRAGLFCFLFPLPGAWLLIRFWVFGLISTHPVEQVDRVGTAPIWLGAANLVASSCCPMKS